MFYTTSSNTGSYNFMLKGISCVILLVFQGAPRWAQPPIIEEATTARSVLLNLPSSYQGQPVIFHYRLANGLTETAVHDRSSAYVLAGLAPASSYFVQFGVNLDSSQGFIYSSEIPFSTPSLGESRDGLILFIAACLDVLHVENIYSENTCQLLTAIFPMLCH